MQTLALRLASTDQQLLARTFEGIDGADVEPRNERVDTYAAARMGRKPFSGEFPEASMPGSVTHVDVFHISQEDLAKLATSGARARIARGRRAKRYRYGIVFVDGYSKRYMFYALAGLSESEIEQCFTWYSMQLGTALTTGGIIELLPGALRHFHTDGGSSLVCKRIETLLAKLGYGATVTGAPHTPQHNAVAESAVRYIKQRLPAVMTVGDIPPDDWHYACTSLIVAHNKLVSRKVIGEGGLVEYVSPEELFTGRAPTMKHSIICGTPCRVRHLGLNAPPGGAFAVRGVPGKAYLWAGDGIQHDGGWRHILGWAVRLDTGELVITREVAFDEAAIVEGGAQHVPRFARRSDDVRSSSRSNWQLAGESADSDDDDDESFDEDDAEHSSANDVPSSAEEDSDDADDNDDDDGAIPSLIDSDDGDSDDDEQRGSNEVVQGSGASASVQPELEPIEPAPPKLVRDPIGRSDRSSRGNPQLFAPEQAKPAAVRRARRMTVVADVHAAPEVSTLPKLKPSDVKIPQTYREALSSVHSERWKQAIADHLASHAKRGTFKEELVPEKTRVLPTQWLFSIREDTEGNVGRFRARTVLGGHRQRPGLDFQETFSPTIRAEQVRLLLAVGARCQGQKNSEKKIEDVQVRVLRAGDVKDAYLQSELEPDERPLHDLPLGYVPTMTAPPGYKVVGRSIYAHPGLKQAGRAWHRTQRTQLLERGFEEYPNAPCIYYKDLGNDEFIVVGTFVDDLLWLGFCNDPKAIDRIVEDLKEHYEVKMASSLSKFLGANFTEHELGISMHLKHYLTDVLERHGMADCDPVVTPEAVPRDLGKLDETLLRGNAIRQFQQVTGELMFASTTVRFDIAHAVGMLARRMAKPRVCDAAAAKRVLRYLRGTVDLGILFPYAKNKDEPGLVACADSDWASDPEKRKSTTGYITFFNGAPISWRSGLQDVVAGSSCEAEYVALSEAAREVVYLRGLLGFLGQDVRRPTTIYEDNQGCIDLVNNPVHHPRTKHIDVKWHYTRQVQADGEITVTKIHTDFNHADILTKATTPGTFVRHVTHLMRRVPAVVRPE